MKNLLIFVCFLCLAGYSWSEPLDRKPKKDIRDVFTHQQFTSAGLHKLSEAELVELSGNLYGWEFVKVVKTASASPARSSAEVTRASEKPEAKIVEPVVSARQEQQFGRESIVEKEKIVEEKKAPKSIVSSIEGGFEGWRGNTVFRLENGQVWRQTDKSVFYERLQNPKIEIKKGLLGVYYLKVEGYGSRCKVKRVH